MHIYAAVMQNGIAAVLKTVVERRGGSNPLCGVNAELAEWLLWRIANPWACPPEVQILYSA